LGQKAYGKTDIGRRSFASHLGQVLSAISTSSKRICFARGFSEEHMLITPIYLGSLVVLWVVFDVAFFPCEICP